MRYAVLLVLLLAGCSTEPTTRAQWEAAAAMFGSVPQAHNAQCTTVAGITNCHGF